MRVRVFEEGFTKDDGHEYDLRPVEAVEMFADEIDLEDTIGVVVVPVDDEARALSGWQSDDEYDQYRLYVIKPIFHYEVTEVRVVSQMMPNPAVVSRGVLAGNRGDRG